jgi:KDO2-lipid IV(A) lauroyltransferase
MTPAGYVAQVFPAWSDYLGEDDVEAARRMNQFIEARVLEAPEQYLWTHKRFKTRPPGLSSLYGDDGR